MEQVIDLEVARKINLKFEANEILKDDNFDIISCIGAGSFGKVFKI